MTLAEVRAALEARLDAIAPAILTAWENVPYEPTIGTPFQRVFLLTATPDNREIGPAYTERGFMQVSLCYPLGNGPADAMARAELIRTAFPFATTITAGSGSVLINQTPEISPAGIEDDWYVLPVRVRFEARTGG